ncbi:MAG: hypothetical protein H0W75_03580 [Chitinophagaceae bacterium]|nr:hypothetical protein [Chitinophagaceae bacterium]
MKVILSTIIFLTLTTILSSCHSQPMQTVFVSNQKDTATELKASKIYILKKKTTNSDFDYSKLKDIDGNIKDTLNIRNLMPIFEPKSGQLNYFQFLATFKGEGYNGGEAPLIKDFHDILIIKTDTDNKIIDAFQYTLEWAEPPLQFDLFKSSADNITLINNLDIRQLKFKRTDSWSDDNKDLKESGTIQLK